MWGAIAGGLVGQAIGGYFNNKAQEKANASNEAIAAQNTELQREFAQNGVRWKVEDAKRSGIHPLAALGAQTTSFSPIAIGQEPNTSVGDAFIRGGQDVSRAISATRTAEERSLATLQVQSAQLDLEGKALDNQIKNSQLHKLNATGPAFPGSESFIPGQGNSGGAGGLVTKPMERTASHKSAPHMEPGAINDLGWATTATGVVPVPSKDVKERIEDSLPQEFSHFWRNNVAPNWGGGTKPPKTALPKGATEWEWNHFSQEFRPYYPKYNFERNPKMRR